MMVQMVIMLMVHSGYGAWWLWCMVVMVHGGYGA